MIPVDNNRDLARDPTSHAIVNTNRDAYENYMRTIKKQKEYENDLQLLKEGQKNLEDKINTITELLSELCRKI